MTPRKVLVKMVVHRLRCAHDSSWPHEGDGFKHNPHFEWLTLLCDVFQNSDAAPGSWLTDEEHAALKAFLGCLPTNDDMEKFGSFRRGAFTRDILREGYDLWIASTVMDE